MNRLLSCQNYKEVVLHFFNQSRLGEPHLTMSDFSKKIGVSSSTLSEIINMRHHPSPKTLKKLINAFDLNESESLYLINLVRESGAKNFEVREVARQTNQKQRNLDGYVNLSEDRFKEISDWYYLAIFEFLKKDDVGRSPEVISSKLGVDVHTVESALIKLSSLGIVYEKRGYFYAKDILLNVDAKGEVSLPIQGFHRSMIEYFLEHGLTQPPAQRDIASKFFHVDEEDLQMIKEEIKLFRFNLHAKLNGKKSNKKKLYVFCSQFFEIGNS
jgi:uncharacterized protein (TIGR02147 family)